MSRIAALVTWLFSVSPGLAAAASCKRQKSWRRLQFRRRASAQMTFWYSLHSSRAPLTEELRSLEHAALDPEPADGFIDLEQQGGLKILCAAWSRVINPSMPAWRYLRRFLQARRRSQISALAPRLRISIARRAQDNPQGSAFGQVIRPACGVTRATPENAPQSTKRPPYGGHHFARPAIERCVLACRWRNLPPYTCALLSTIPQSPGKCHGTPLVNATIDGFAMRAMALSALDWLPLGRGGLHLPVVRLLDARAAAPSLHSATTDQARSSFTLSSSICLTFFFRIQIVLHQLTTACDARSALGSKTPARHLVASAGWAAA